MKRVFLLLILLFVASVTARATDITVPATTGITWTRTTTAPQLRIFYDQTFTASDSVVVIGGNPQTGGFAYKTVTCTLLSGTLTIPSFTIKSTRDGIDRTTSRVSFFFFTTAGANLGPFDPYVNLAIPASITSASGCSPSGTCGTLAELKNLQTGIPPEPPPQFYTAAQIDRLFATVAAGAPSGSTYITEVPVAALPNSFALSTLTNGLLKHSSGVPARAIPGTDYEVPLTFSSPLLRSVDTISIPNAAADGSTKGAAAFTAADFNASSGLISLDYTNGQAAASGVKGFLTAADWATFNAKQSALTIGNLTVGAGLGVSGGTGAVIGSGAVVSLATSVPTSVVNDTNVTGSIAGNVLTLGWTGTLAAARLSDTAVTPGSYTAANITVDQQGRITAASNGSGGGGSGTVNTGVSGSLAVYPSNGTTVDDLTLGTANQILGINSGATGNEYKTLAVGSSGTAPNIAHAANSVTFHFPLMAGSSVTSGLLSNATQTIPGAKTFSTSVDAIIINSAISSFPTAGSAGRLYYQTDGARGLAVDQGAQFYNLAVDEINVKAYGAKVDGKLVGDASMTNGSPTLASAGAAFTSADVGKSVAVDGAGAAGVTLQTTILALVDSSHVTLNANASTTVSPTNAYFGTDDTTALTNAIGAANTNGSVIRIPSGRMVLTGGGLTIGNGSGTISSINGIRIIGAGGGKTQISFQGGATEIWWMGNASVPILTFAGPISGSGVEGIFFDCKVGPNAATSAIRTVWAHKGKFWDISVTGHSGYAIDMDTAAAPITGASLGGDDNILGELWLGPPSSATGGGLRMGAADTNKAATSRNQVIGMQAYTGTDAASAGINMRFGDSNTFYGVTTFAQGSGKGLLITATPSSAFYPSATSFYNSALQGGTSVSGSWTPASKVSFWPYSTADGEIIPSDAGFNGVTTGTTLPSSLPPTFFGAFTVRDQWTYSASIVVPTIYGGTATTSDLNLQTTSGVGASGADMHFLVGNNGATEAATILNSGFVGVGTTAPATQLHVKAPAASETQLRVEGVDNARFDLYTTTGNANSRNWTWRTDVTAFGDMSLYQSATQGGNGFTGGIRRFYISNFGSIVAATTGALATSATDGFLYIPSTAGTPTGVPTTQATATIPIVIDTTNNRGYFYNGGWQRFADGYTLMAHGGSGSPADATTYYFGSMFSAAFTDTTAAERRIYIPKTGTLTAAYITFNNSGTLGTTETSTISIRLNNTSDTTISSSVQNNATVTVYNTTGLTLAVTAGDYVEIKWVSPTWATNPTNVLVSAVLLIQ